MIYRSHPIPEGAAIDGSVPATIHYFEPKDVILEPLEEPVFTLQDLLDYGKYVAEKFSDNSPIEIAKYLKEKHNITIP